MTEFLRVMIYALAVYRMSELISIDDGPYEIFKDLRAYFGRSADESKFMKQIALLLNCPYCVGIWISAMAVLLWSLNSRAMDLLAIWMAVAGIQTFMEQMSNSRNS